MRKPERGQERRDGEEETMEAMRLPMNSGALSRMFELCNLEQEPEYQPEKRSVRIHGHSTTIRLERAFWNVLEHIAREERETVGSLIGRVHDHCMVANDKNLSSCLRVVCLKYMNLFG